MNKIFLVLTILTLALTQTASADDMDGWLRSNQSDHCKVLYGLFQPNLEVFYYKSKVSENSAVIKFCPNCQQSTVEKAIKVVADEKSNMIPFPNELSQIPDHYVDTNKITDFQAELFMNRCDNTKLSQAKTNVYGLTFLQLSKKQRPCVHRMFLEKYLDRVGVSTTSQAFQRLASARGGKNEFLKVCKFETEKTAMEHAMESFGSLFMKECTLTTVSEIVD
jgi:hypothetical protein